MTGATERWVVVEAAEDCPFPAGPPIAIHRESEPWKTTGRLCSMTAQGPPPPGASYDCEKTWAVARLIAAAPELLAVVRSLYAQPWPTSCPPDLSKRMYEALAKAGVPPWEPLSPEERAKFDSVTDDIRRLP